MAIAFVAEGTVANVASGNITLSEPAGVQEGDLLVACIAYRDTPAFTNPSGGEWTTIATQQSSGNTSTTASTAIASGHMAYCIRGASAPNFTFTRTSGDVARGMVFAFRGVDPDTPLDNANAYTAPSNTSTPTVSGWTPANADSLYVMFCAGADNVTSSAWQANGGSGWSSWTEQEDTNTTSGADTNLSVAYATSSAADAITSFQVTKATSSRHVLFAAGFNAAPPAITMEASTLTLTAGDFSVNVPDATFDQDGVTYLLRDKFSSDVDPLVDGNASEGSGVGYRDVTNSTLYAENGRLRGGSSGSEGKLVYLKASGDTSGWQRMGGRTFAAIVNIWDGDLSDVSLYLAETNGSFNGYGIRFGVDSNAYVIEPDGNQITVLKSDGNPIKAVRYVVGITLNEERGAVYWISALAGYEPTGTEWAIPTYPTTRILWVSTLGTFTAVHPTIRSNSGTGGDQVVFEDVRLLDIAGWAGADGMAIVADRFDRADNASSLGGSWTVDSGTWGISGNQAYLASGSSGSQAWLEASVADALVVCEWNTGSDVASSNIELILRRGSVSNTALFLYQTSGAFTLDSGQSGSYTTINNQGFTFNTSTNYRVLMALNGDFYRVHLNGDAIAWEPFQDTAYDQAGTKFGLAHWGSAAGHRWDYFAVYPITFTLPAAIQTATMDLPTVGSELENKTFADTNGTALTTHDADWTVAAGTWTIQSNRASVSGSGDLYAYLDAGQADYQVTVDVVAGTLGDLRAGVILRRADANNMIRVRLFVDTAQANNDEIEIETVIGGSAVVAAKCYLNDYFASAGTYELKCQVEGDILHVYLDGVLHQTYYIPSSLLTGQGVGLYREGTVDDGATFDDVIVDAIGDSSVNVTMEGSTLTLTAGDFSVSVAQPGVTLEGAAVALTAGDFSVAVTPPSVTMEGSALQLIGGDFSVGVQQPAVTMEGATLSLTAGDYAVDVAQPGVTLEGATLQLAAGDFAASVQQPAVTLEGAALALIAGDFGVSVEQPEIVMEGATLTLAAGDFAVSTEVAVTLESAELQLVAGDFSVSVTQPAITMEGATVALTAGDFTVDVAQPGVTLETSTITLAAGDFIVSTGVTVTLEGATLNLTAGDFSVSVQQPTVTLEGAVLQLTSGDFGLSVEQPGVTMEGATLAFTAGDFGASTGVVVVLEGAALELVAGDFGISVQQSSVTMEGAALGFAAGDFGVSIQSPNVSMEGAVLTLAAGDFGVAALVPITMEGVVLSLAAGDFAVSVQPPAVAMDGAALLLTAGNLGVTTSVGPIQIRARGRLMVNIRDEGQPVVWIATEGRYVVEIEAEGR